MTKTRTPVDPHLKATLQAFYESWSGKRAACFRDVDFEALREALAEVKDDAIARTDELLARFEEQARRHGSRVLRAADSAEARHNAIMEIAGRMGMCVCPSKWGRRSERPPSEENSIKLTVAQVSVPILTASVLN